MTEIGAMADILEVAAALFFPNTHGRIAHRSPISNAASSRLHRQVAPVRPMWIHEMTYTYVLESAHELKSLTILLRAEHGVGAGEPILRGVGDGHRLAHDSSVFCMAF